MTTCKSRPRSYFLTALVLSTATWLPTTASASSPALRQCQSNLSACQADDQTCQSNLQTCTDDLSSCESSLAHTCGNGIVEYGEVCDDGNTNGCGSCSADCQTFKLSSATGFILAVAGSSLVDGDLFSLNDGTGTTQVFEFDLDANTAVGNIPIFISGGQTAAAVALKIQQAIESSSLEIGAVNASNMVSLSSTRATSLGNKPITEAVADPDFLVSGMSGGAGGDCASDVGCADDRDCASGNCGGSSPGVCQ